MSQPRGRADAMRDEQLMRPRIAEVLREGPKTIPDIAAALGAPEGHVTLWVMALRRYGVLEEMPKSKADDYYAYRLLAEGPRP